MHVGTSCPKITSNEVHRTIAQALKKNLSGPVSRVLFFWVNFPKEAIISLRRQLPAVSSSPPEKKPKRNASGRCFRADSFLFGLAPDGVYRAKPVTWPAGELLPHRFTLTSRQEPAGGLFSVALSLTLRLVGVTHHRILRSPDFPLTRMFLAQKMRFRPER